MIALESASEIFTLSPSVPGGTTLSQKLPLSEHLELVIFQTALVEGYGNARGLK